MLLGSPQIGGRAKEEEGEPDCCCEVRRGSSPAARLGPWSSAFAVGRAAVAGVAGGTRSWGSTRCFVKPSSPSVRPP